MTGIDEEQHTAEARDKTILLVEDNVMVRDVLREMLSSGGFEVLEAADGVEALRVLKTKEFDAIVTDLVMPECDGIELLRAVRKGYPGVKVLAVSGASLAPVYLKAARALGAGGVLTKPIGRETLLAAVSRLFEDAA